MWRNFKMGLLFLCLWIPSAHAGLFELGVSGSYFKEHVNEVSQSERQSLTGSLAYYFWAMSALELSYTQGLSRQTGVTQQENDYVLIARFELIGLDLIFNMADKESSFQPYIKGGGMYQIKRITFKESGRDAVYQDSEGLSPSAGAGFRLLLSKTFAFKLGVDYWTTPMDEPPVKTDMAAKAGISWVF